MTSLFWLELRIRRGTLIGWSAGLLVFFGVYLSFYRSAIPTHIWSLLATSADCFLLRRRAPALRPATSRLHRRDVPWNSR